MYINEGKDKENQGIPQSCLHFLLDSPSFSTCIVQHAVHVMGDPLFFVCAIISSPTLDTYNLIKKLQKDCEHLPPINESQLTRGAFVAVFVGMKGWHRGVLDTQDLSGLWNVLCCDIGSYVQVLPSSIRALPPQFSTLPRLSLAASIVETFVPLRTIWEEHITIDNRLWASNMVALPVGDSGELQLVCDLRTPDGSSPLAIVVLTDWLPLRPLPASPPPPPQLQLPSKCEVTLTAICSIPHVYVQPVSDKEVTEQVQVLHQELAMHCLLVPPLERIPVVGTLLGVRSGVDNQFYRGLVTLPLSDTTAIVSMVDYGNREEVHCSRLHPLSTELAEIPCLATLVKIDSFVEQPFNIAAYQYLSKLLTTRTRLQLTFEPPDGPVTLIESFSGISVNVVLKKALLFSWQRKDEPFDEHVTELISNYSLERPCMNILIHTKLPVGRTSQFVMLQYVGAHIFACCLANDPLLRFVAHTLTDGLTKYVKQIDDDRYVPNNRELCVVQFDDGLWYRGVASGNSFTSSEVTFVDFGNIAEVPHTKIRRMPFDFNEVPLLATHAQLAGLKESDFPNDALSKRIAQLLTSKSTFSGIVLDENNDDLVSIFVPKVFTALLEEELIPDPETRVKEISKKLKKYQKLLKELPDYTQALEPDAPRKFQDFLTYYCNPRVSQHNPLRQETIERVKEQTLIETSMKQEETIRKVDKSDLLMLIDFDDVREPGSIGAGVNIMDKSVNIDISSLSPERPVQKLISFSEEVNHKKTENPIVFEELKDVQFECNANTPLIPEINADSPLVPEVHTDTPLVPEVHTGTSLFPEVNTIAPLMPEPNTSTPKISYVDTEIIPENMYTQNNTVNFKNDILDVSEIQGIDVLDLNTPKQEEQNSKKVENDIEIHHFEQSTPKRELIELLEQQCDLNLSVESLTLECDDTVDLKQDEVNDAFAEDEGKEDSDEEAKAIAELTALQQQLATKCKEIAEIRANRRK